MRHLIATLLGATAATAALAAPTGPDLQPSKLTLPNSTTLPATCTVGMTYVDTDASPSSSRFYVCTATNTWTAQGAGTSTPGGSTTQLQYNNAGAFGGLSWWVVNNGSTYSTINGKLRIGDTVTPDFSLEVAGSGLGLVGRGISGTGATPSFAIEGAAGGVMSFEAPNIAANSDYRIGDISGGSYSAGYLLSVRSSSLAACVDNMIQRNNSSGGIQLECIADSPTVNDSGTIVTTAPIGLSTDQIQDRSSGGLLIAPGGTLTINVTGAGQGISLTPGSGGNVVIDNVSDMTLTSTGVLNTTNGSLRVKNSSTEPTTCTVGDVFQDTSLAVGQQWKLCTATDTWTQQGGANPAGSDTYVQYKSGTSFGGDSGLTYTSGSGSLGVSKQVTVGDSPSGGTANMSQLLDNDVNYAPDPTCAASGTAGSTTWLDLDESASDSYGICDGTTQVLKYSTAGVYVGTGTDIDQVFGFDQGTGTDPTLTWDDSASNMVIANAGLVLAKCTAIAGAGTVSADGCNAISFTGSTNIDTINTCNAENTGRVLYIYAGAYTGTVNDGTGNVQLSGNFAFTANDILVLFCDGTNWLGFAGQHN